MGGHKSAVCVSPVDNKFFSLANGLGSAPFASIVPDFVQSHLDGRVTSILAFLREDDRPGSVLNAQLDNNLSPLP